MVSSGTVSNDLSSLNQNLSSYTSNIGNLAGSWKGASYENINAKAEEFVNEYKQVITAQMNAFMAAISNYEKYVQVKSELASARAALASAQANGDDNAAASYSGLIAQLETQLENLKNQINANLAAASSPKLSASPITAAQASAEAVQLSLTGGTYVERALQSAFQIAGDDTHGYSQQRRWGNPDYDCSSFVISCWQNAGVDVRGAGAGYTGNMRRAFTSTGLFEWVPGNPRVEDLRPGDVLLNESVHTEMYIGDGKMIGAHGDRDGRGGDSGGKEINVVNYHGGWQGYLRYIGDRPATLSV